MRLPLDGQHFDVAIIGGGINGVAIARECAAAGRSTLIVERNDFASGTTSRSTRIIHGGLRYLEHGEISLVRESVRERQRLLAERPHLVRPMQFVLGLPPGRRTAMEIRFGLWLYRKYAGGKRRGDRDSVAAMETLIDREVESLRLFSYEDAQCEFPERLAAEWLTDAVTNGAVARNHTRALDIEKSGGKVTGLRLRDLFSGVEYRISAASIINATGPWADEMCRDAGIVTGEPLIGGVRGSHIVLPLFAGAPTTALYTEAIDGRPVFLIPWNGQMLFGTTEVGDSHDPSRVRPSDSEIEYLVASLRHLCPRAPLPEIRYAFAGVRPLPFAPGKNAGAITRKHFLRDHTREGAAGLISVIGGKLTTAASLARQCARLIGIAVPEPRLTSVAHVGAVDSVLNSFTEHVAKVGGLSQRAAADLVGWHGERALHIAQLTANKENLRAPISEATNHPVAEAVFAVQEENAVTLADILLRRVPIALGEWTNENTIETSRRIGTALGWDEQRIAHEVEAFESERSAFLFRPATARIGA